MADLNLIGAAGAKYIGHSKAPGKYVRLEPDGVTTLDIAGVVDMAATVAAHTDPFLACELRDAFKMHNYQRGEVREGVKFYVSWPRAVGDLAPFPGGGRLVRRR